MQAVRVTRYRSGKRRIVRFCGAYHGWWGDVQPGVGNPLPARDTYTLSEMSERTLPVLRTRRDIACVLVNPLQALHPQRSPQRLPHWFLRTTNRRARRRSSPRMSQRR